MRFDGVIIGGGLAGLAAGIRLQEHGCSCALVNAGQSALHFSSGSFDLLSHMPDGEPVDGVARCLERLTALLPDHPYTRLGAEKTLDLARQAEHLLAAWGLSMTGSLDQGNHFRLTPLGTLRPTWLSSAEVMTTGPDQRFPWEKIQLITIEGFLDFYPEILAANLNELGLACDIGYVSTPALDILRKNPSEFRSINIARVLDRPDQFSAFVRQLAESAGNADVLLLPACFARRDISLVEEASQKVGKPVKLLPTLPPSLIGARISHILSDRFLASGGVIMPGDRAVGYALDKGRISRVYTVNHEDIPLEADHFILSSGSFFSQGLLAGQTGIKEAVFDLDLLEVPEDRADWTAASVFAPQPYAGFGVKTDARMRVSRKGAAIANLYAAGMVLGGYDAPRLGCGAGVALVSALAAAESILEGRD